MVNLWTIIGTCVSVVGYLLVYIFETNISLIRKHDEDLKEVWKAIEYIRGSVLNK